MPGLSETQLLLGLLALALILALGRAFAELAQRLGQSAVLGELLAGVLLGPSVLGALAPGAQATLFLVKPVGDGLSLLSWIGAILLLLVAGMEVDLQILRRFGTVSALAGGFAVAGSLVVGVIFAIQPGPPPPQDAYALGIILSVTAVSVVSSFLLEHNVARRNFAQVILVAGVASETLAWLLVALTSSIQAGSAVAAIRALVAAALFFLAVMTVAWRLTFWAMRRVADLGRVAYGQLSLVLTLTLAAAAITQKLGLHPLLGAFVFGILLGQSPRAVPALKQQLSALTVGVFGPIFFVLAGMRVDIFQLRAGAVLVAILLLLLVATAVKIGLAALGATIGGMAAKEAMLVGIGLNFKGGTDVVVAIILTELGFLSGQAYTMYAVVAVVTVLFSVPLFSRIERTVAPAAEERARLELEEVKQRAYFAHVERMVVPLLPALLPDATAPVADALARGKRAAGEFFDLTALEVARGMPPAPPSARASRPARDLEQPPAAPAASTFDRAEASLVEARRLPGVDLTTHRVETADQAVAALLSTPADGNLIALGAHAPLVGAVPTFGALQDRIVAQASADLLMVIGDGGWGAYPAHGPVSRILVPVVSQRCSLAGSDLAAYLAKGIGAEVVLVTVAQPPSSTVARARRAANPAAMSDLRDAAAGLLADVARRLARVGVPVAQRVVVARDPASAILKELVSEHCQALVLGVAIRGGAGLDLGATARDILSRCGVPTLLLVTR